MILTLNLDKYKGFMKAIFKSEMNFFHNLIEILKQLRRSREYLGIIMNIFLEEYKKCFFTVIKDAELENLYIKEHFSFFENFEQISFKNEISEDFFSDLLKFDLSYENYFLYNKDKLEEKQTYKLEIAQSLIRVLFSREKKKYIKEPFYEFNLIKRIIDKDMEETIEKYGDQFRTLFRKEDICDDFLKYMFFVFGNKMIIESFINPLNKLISEIEPKDRNINQEEFDNLVTEFLSRLKFDIPHVLKILLKILYESIKSHFTIEEDNYGPLYTTLIFNFIISPRVQSIYLHKIDSNLIRCLNRLLRNTCFNFKFPEQDPLKEFNDVVEKNHLKIKKFFKDHIIEIEIDDENVKNSLGDIFNEKYMIYPNFLFHLDIDILRESMKREESEDSKDEESNDEKDD